LSSNSLINLSLLWNLLLLGLGNSLRLDNYRLLRSLLENICTSLFLLYNSCDLLRLLLLLRLLNNSSRWSLLNLRLLHLRLLLYNSLVMLNRVRFVLSLDVVALINLVLSLILESLRLLVRLHNILVWLLASVICGLLHIGDLLLRLCLWLSLFRGILCCWLQSLRLNLVWLNIAKFRNYRLFFALND